MNYICLNGKMQPGDQPALLVSNRGYRYGDGLFETIRVEKKKIRLGQYHFERLFSGLSLLKFEIPNLFTAEKITDEILNLCKKNKCDKSARVRLSVFRGNGGLYDDDRALQYVIECWSLNDSFNKLNENGLVIDIYQGAKKSCDVFSNLKTSSFLPYSMAAVYAWENKLNDCLVLNTNGNIADSTIANIFIIKGRAIFTPSLTEGCINGVMRRYLIEKIRTANYELQEVAITVNDLREADEVFLTNAISGIRWIRQLGKKFYSNKMTAEIFNGFVRTISG